MFDNEMGGENTFIDGPDYRWSWVERFTPNYSASVSSCLRAETASFLQPESHRPKSGPCKGWPGSRIYWWKLADRRQRERLMEWERRVCAEMNQSDSIVEQKCLGWSIWLVKRTPSLKHSAIRFSMLSRLCNAMQLLNGPSRIESCNLLRKGQERQFSLAKKLLSHESI